MFALLLITILVWYAAIHYYLFRKLVGAFAPSPAARRRLITALLLLIVLPFLARLLDRLGFTVLSRAINLPVFVWIAWLFWFFAGGLLLDLWNIIVSRIPFTRTWQASARRQLQVLVVVILAATGWSYVEAYTPLVRTVIIRSPLLKQDSSVKLVQVSDVHLGMMRSAHWNRMVCQMVESLKPDLLVSTGDMVDTWARSVASQADTWAALKPPLGKFAVLGNHEYYLGLATSLAFHERAGFRLLRQDVVTVNESLTLAGVDDREGARLGLPCRNKETDLSLPANGFKILLKHQPIVTTQSAGRFDLQLSGHTHNGQLFPFHLFVWLYHHQTHGLYTLKEGVRLYISSGTGTWGPPLRLFAPPEITVFMLEPEHPRD